jgi:protein Tex
VHISQLANKFVKDPHEVVKVNQRVKVKVVSVDLDRRRIALTMKD